MAQHIKTRYAGQVDVGGGVSIIRPDELFSSQVAQFLARTSGLDATHISAYTALIDGLVTDGVWTKLDFLYILATADSTTALLNLVSSSYNGIAHGSPTFTADRGFTGTQASSTIYIDTQFNPSNAAGRKYGQSDAHISAWNITNTTGGFAIGSGDGNQVDRQTLIFPKKTGDGLAQFLVNGFNTPASVTNATARGFYIATSLAGNLGGTAAGGPWQIASASAGSQLSATNASNLNSRLRTFMTVVGVP